MRYNCTKEGMGDGFKCIFYGSIYRNQGTCSKSGTCEHKELDLRDQYQSSAPSANEVETE